MKVENDSPPISSSIINKLEEVFPLRDDFDITTGQNALMYYYGQRSVIRYLKNQHKLQNENILTKS
jgi:hypothetical protein|tara:strand:- start:615 stop:812 length:198 start_codon:yes stop_codon:yes gene_type:complete